MNARHGDAAALLAAVGHTPLVEIPLAAEAHPGARLFAKLESVNPSGSIKDRPVARMLERALDAGEFAGGRRLLDCSSGNAGIAYAMFGAALGIPVTLVLPGNASRECLARIGAHGAEIVLTDPLEGYDFALATSRRLAAAAPHRYWHCDQYANAENWRAHYDGTGVEILAQLGERGLGPPDALVAGIGTGGTLTGLGRRLRSANPGLHVAAAIPDIFPGIEGLRPLGQPGSTVPSLLDEALIGTRHPVTLDDAAAMCRRLAGLGLFVGASSGACVHVALRLAAGGSWPTLVTVLNDTGDRYVSAGLWTRPTSAQDLRQGTA